MEATCSISTNSNHDHSPFLSDNMVMWSNSAFIPDDDDDGDDFECSSKGSNKNCTFFTKNVAQEDQDVKLREELKKELEKQLEQEIMEGMLDLVRRLSNLKAKQIIRSLNKFNLDDFLNVLYGSSCDISCKVDDFGSPDWHRSQTSLADIVTQFSNDNEEEEQVFEDSDKESTIGRWAYHSE